MVRLVGINKTDSGLGLIINVNTGELQEIGLGKLAKKIKEGLRVVNVDIEGGKIVNNEASNNRLPIYVVDEGIASLVGDYRATILHTLVTGGDIVGYKVLNHKLKTMNITNEDAIKIGQQVKYSNAKVVVREGTAYLSAIKGSFKEMSKGDASGVGGVSANELAGLKNAVDNGDVRGLLSIIQNNNRVLRDKRINNITYNKVGFSNTINELVSKGGISSKIALKIIGTSSRDSIGSETYDAFNTALKMGEVNICKSLIDLGYSVGMGQSLGIAVDTLEDIFRCIDRDGNIENKHKDHASRVCNIVELDNKMIDVADRMVVNFYKGLKSAILNTNGGLGVIYNELGEAIGEGNSKLVSKWLDNNSPVVLEHYNADKCDRQGIVSVLIDFVRGVNGDPWDAFNILEQVSGDYKETLTDIMVMELLLVGDSGVIKELIDHGYNIYKEVESDVLEYYSGDGGLNIVDALLVNQLHQEAENDSGILKSLELAKELGFPIGEDFASEKGNMVAVAVAIELGYERSARWLLDNGASQVGLVELMKEERDSQRNLVGSRVRVDRFNKWIAELE